MTTIPDLTTQLYLEGTWREGSGEPLSILNPSTGEEITTISAASEVEVDAAVAAAQAAQQGEWAATPPSQKAALLNRLADLVERDSDTLATLESLDMGVPNGIAQMLFVPNLLGSLRYYAGWADKINGESISNDGYFGRPTHAYTVRQPLGVIAAIVPWNAPLMILGWKLAPALACGNSVIVKPAEDASLSILHLAKLADEAGFPPGALQVLPGAGPVTGEALATHDGVQKVSFTGSTEVGRRILSASASNFKRTTLELGGKSPQIVFDDANLENSLPSIANGLFFNSGEVCAAGTRVFVQRGILDAVTEGLQAAAASQQVGDPFAEGTTMGPLINKAQLERVSSYVEKGRAEGAGLITGGNALDGRGFFLEPTLFSGTNEMAIAREEIFGPVGTLIPFDTEEEAVALANDNVYGLAATVYTQDVGRAHQVSAQLHAGAVGVNGWSPLAPQLPWGGVKASGIGRELGYEGILANTEVKTVTVVF